MRPQNLEKSFLFLISDILCSFPTKDSGGAFVQNTSSTPLDETLEKHLAVAFKQTESYFVPQLNIQESIDAWAEVLICNTDVSAQSFKHVLRRI